MTKDNLILCEQFYSIQGEGVTVGVPAVFLRLASCNLQCAGFSYRDPSTGEHLGCDTKAVWRQGKRWANQAVVAHWQAQGWLAALRRGAHVVLTGGEPLLQQAGLLNFIQQLENALEEEEGVAATPETLVKPTTRCFIEIETNASRVFEPALLTRLDQINASPKLSNSGEEKKRRYQPAVLATLAALPKAFFKFVIMQASDIEEVIRDFVEPFALPPERVLLMPEGGQAALLRERSEWLVESCKAYGFRYSPRLHIALWGEVTGI